MSYRQITLSHKKALNSYVFNSYVLNSYVLNSYVPIMNKQ